MKIVVYDDNRDFLELIKNALGKINSKHGNIFGTPVYFSGKNEVMEYASANKDQLTVFLLDIMVGDVSVGYEIAKHIKDTDPCNLVIYVSDFVEDLISNVYEKINLFTFIAKENVGHSDELEKVLLAAHAQLTKKIFLAEGKDYFKPIKYTDILYFEKVKETEYTNLFHKNGVAYIKDTLKSIKSKVDGNGVFLYSKKEYIVNVNEIAEILKHEKRLLISNGDCIPFSPTRKKELIRCMSER